MMQYFGTIYILLEFDHNGSMDLSINTQLERAAKAMRSAGFIVELNIKRNGDEYTSPLIIKGSAHNVLYDSSNEGRPLLTIEALHTLWDYCDAYDIEIRARPKRKAKRDDAI